jgi:hypothetical protein
MNFKMNMEQVIRDYLEDFRCEFASDGQVRNSPNSVDGFYNKWRQFIKLVTGVNLTLIRANWDTMGDVFSVSNACALRAVQFLGNSRS